jgi:hypothetical protein
MREIRLYGSEGGGALTGSPYPYLAKPLSKIEVVQSETWCEEMARINMVLRPEGLLLPAQAVRPGEQDRLRVHRPFRAECVITRDLSAQNDVQMTCQTPQSTPMKALSRGSPSGRQHFRPMFSCLPRSHQRNPTKLRSDAGNRCVIESNLSDVSLQGLVNVQINLMKVPRAWWYRIKRQIAGDETIWAFRTNQVGEGRVRPNYLTELSLSESSVGCLKEKGDLQLPFCRPVGKIGSHRCGGLQKDHVDIVVRRAVFVEAIETHFQQSHTRHLHEWMPDISLKQDRGHSCDPLK